MFIISLSAQAQTDVEVHSRRYYDSLFVASTGDSVSIPFYKRLSFSTNLIDWVFATPNLSMEIDVSGKKRNMYSVVLTGKVAPSINKHTTNPRWVYHVTSAKGELRRYWRTGNQENAHILDVERDTTLWSPLRQWSYFRRRYLSSRYVNHPRYWRAYYLGLYGTANLFSVCIDGEGKQGKAVSAGLSGGMSIPIYKHFDGSGWDLELGASAGVMVAAYDEYKYQRESACYEYLTHKNRHFVPRPVVQDAHISLVYRLKTIDNKVLYGATRFMYREERRAEREEQRRRKEADRIAAADSANRYTDINKLVDRSKAQLALYTDTTAAYYEVLKVAIEYTEYDYLEDLKTMPPNEWKFKRDVLMRNLEYYMNLANEMAPESQRTDRLEREAQRKKADKQRLKDEQLQAKMAEKQAKEEQKKLKGEQKNKDKEQMETVPDGADTSTGEVSVESVAGEDVSAEAASEETHSEETSAQEESTEEETSVQEESTEEETSVQEESSEEESSAQEESSEEVNEEGGEE